MSTSFMAKEALEAPQVIANQLSQNDERCILLGEKIRHFKPEFVYIIGRGSSDHAGVFAKYLIEVELGLPVCAAAPSVASIYGKTLTFDRALVIAISQSGRSPDILQQTQAAKSAGALCIALVNDQTSPLANSVDFVLPLYANAEYSVAATKSYLATLSALLHLVTHWGQLQEMRCALKSLPKYMQQAIDAPSQLSSEFIKSIEQCVVLGRGFGYAISREIALKLKEVCGIHAEAFSSAEFLHGPIALAEKSLSVIDVSVQDESFTSHTKQIDEVKNRGGTVLTLTQSSHDINARLAPLTILQRFYIDLERAAIELGRNPDKPAGLKKITQTV